MAEEPVPPTPPPTVQENITFSGQRQVSVAATHATNFVWEYTQSAIAIMVVLANITAALGPLFTGVPFEFPVVLNSSLFMVLGFYLARASNGNVSGMVDTPAQSYISKGK